MWLIFHVGLDVGPFYRFRCQPGPLTRYVHSQLFFSCDGDFVPFLDGLRGEYLKQHVVFFITEHEHSGESFNFLRSTAFEISAC